MRRLSESSLSQKVSSLPVFRPIVLLLFAVSFVSVKSRRKSGLAESANSTGLELA
jgi:hypothetical protein